jgi:hypothetical protein
MYLQRFWTAEERNQHTWLQKLGAFVPILLIPAGTVIYMLYLWHVKGSPFIVSTEEVTVWHRHFTFPWVGILNTIQLLFSHSLTHIVMYRDVINLFFTLAFLVTLALGWRRLPLYYSLFGLALALFSLSFPVATTEPLASMPRYLMVIFPITVIYAWWGKQRTFDRFYLALALPLFAMFVLLFISHVWVA